MNNNILVFTDLDGTLLDSDTYSYKSALPALKLIKNKKIPLIFCSSKTKSEIEMYRKRIGNDDPFISENGGGIYIPRDYFSHDVEPAKSANGYEIIELGTSYKKIVKVLNSIKKDSALRIKGFSEMSVTEVSQYTGLDRRLAKLSKRRHFDEPFLIFGNDKESIYVTTEIIRRGYNHTQGGIFHHIMGKNDKGKAVKILIRIFKKKHPKLLSVALGDSFNDLPMFEVVDRPILLKNPDGEYDSRIKLSNMIFADGVGPKGWNQAVLALLSDLN